MFSPATIRPFLGARARTRNRLILAIVCMLSIVGGVAAYSFFSVNSQYLMVSSSSDRSDARPLSSRNVNGDIYIFLSSAVKDVKNVSYYLNPDGNLSRRHLILKTYVAPYDVAGVDANGRPFPLRSPALKEGANLIVSKIVFKNGYVHHDFTWFNVSDTPVSPPTTSTAPSTTAPSTTTPRTTAPTTTMPSHGSGGVDHNCVVGTLSTHGPCVDYSQIPQFLKGTSQRSLFSTSPASQGSGEPGAFRSRCDFSHMNNDDPVLYLNQPGKAHLHTFFGNTLTNAYSTSESLKRSGNSTCSGGTVNRSSYWVPTMLDSRTGRPIAPNDDRGIYNSDLEIYYKLGYQGVGHNSVEPFPNGLQMIAGNPATQTTVPSQTRNGWYPTKYYCEGPNPQDRAALEGRGTPISDWDKKSIGIPTCLSGEVLVMDVIFPQCWDGRLTSPNGRDHLAYGHWIGGANEHQLSAADLARHRNGYTVISEELGCPPSHPRSLPAVELFIRYRVPQGQNTANWRLSSDRYTNGPGGYSGHADYVFAWEDGIFDTIVQRCYKGLADCGYSFGDGREPTSPRFIPGLNDKMTGSMATMAATGSSIPGGGSSILAATNQAFIYCDLRRLRQA